MCGHGKENASRVVRPFCGTGIRTVVANAFHMVGFEAFMVVQIVRNRQETSFGVHSHDNNGRIMFFETLCDSANGAARSCGP